MALVDLIERAGRVVPRTLKEREVDRFAERIFGPEETDTDLKGAIVRSIFPPDGPWWYCPLPCPRVHRETVPVCPGCGASRPEWPEPGAPAPAEKPPLFASSLEATSTRKTDEIAEYVEDTHRTLANTTRLLNDERRRNAKLRRELDDAKGRLLRIESDNQYMIDLIQRTRTLLPPAVGRDAALGIGDLVPRVRDLIKRRVVNESDAEWLRMNGLLARIRATVQGHLPDEDRSFPFAYNNLPVTIRERLTAKEE